MDRALFNVFLLLILIFGGPNREASLLEAARLFHKQFAVVHQWTTSLNTTFPTPEAMELALENGHYDAKRTLLPVDVDVEYREDGLRRTFLTIPRLSFGVPYSLAVIAAAEQHQVLNPRLLPYPSYEWHVSHGANCSQITSAIRTYIDACRRLWVVDAGQINSLQWCSPQILAFDLVTDQQAHRYILPSDQYTAGVSVYTALAVDASAVDECCQTRLYIADAWGHGLIVYDVSKRKSWRIEHPLMQPEFRAQMAGAASDGIFTVSLSPQQSGQPERYLYFHSLNGCNEIRMPLQVVNNASLWPAANASQVPVESATVLGSRGTQCESEIMDSSGNLYCSLIGSSALVRWQEGKEYTPDNLQVVAYDPRQWRFVTGLKVNRNARGEEELWALSTEPALFVDGSSTKYEVNYQIIGCRIGELLRKKPCTVGFGNSIPY